LISLIFEFFELFRSCERSLTPQGPFVCPGSGTAPDFWICAGPEPGQTKVWVQTCGPRQGWRFDLVVVVEVEVEVVRPPPPAFVHVSKKKLPPHPPVRRQQNSDQDPIQKAPQPQPQPQPQPWRVITIPIPIPTTIPIPTPQTSIPHPTFPHPPCSTMFRSCRVGAWTSRPHKGGT
jgi:hypothetical protein